MNKVVKKIAAVALSGLLVASVFAGCSGGSAKDTYTVGSASPCSIRHWTRLPRALRRR